MAYHVTKLPAGNTAASWKSSSQSSQVAGLTGIRLPLRALLLQGVLIEAWTEGERRAHALGLLDEIGPSGFTVAPFYLREVGAAISRGIPQGVAPRSPRTRG